MVGISVEEIQKSKKVFNLERAIYSKGAQASFFVYRVLNKLDRVTKNSISAFVRPKKWTYRCWIRYKIKGSTDDQIIAMVGDRCHKLLQMALGQRIEENAYFVSTLLREAESRKIKSRVVNWGKKLHEDYKAGKVYQPTELSIAESEEVDHAGLEAFYELTKKRQSIRRFLPKDVPSEVVGKILACALESPSSCNRQSWRFLVIRDPIKKEYLAKIRNVQFLANTPVIICVLVNSEVYSNNGQGDKRITPIMDGSAAMTHLVLASAAAGLGSCWTNFAASISPENMQNFKKYFNLPESMVAVSLVALGFYDKKFPKPFRDNIDSHVFGEL